MRFTKITTIDPDHDPEGSFFVMFHGCGNDENEMVRILHAVDPNADFSSLRGVIHRPYLGGNSWYEPFLDNMAVQQNCSAIGDEVVDMLDSTMLHYRRLVLMGFSQGGYMAYRMLTEHPDVFDSAILLSPSFHDQKTERPDLIMDSLPRVFLGYGDLDTEIPDEDKDAMREALEPFDLDNHVYEGMRHDICEQELEDIRNFIKD